MSVRLSNSGGAGSGAYTGARAFTATAASLAHNTNVLVTFTGEEYDVGGLWVAGSPTRLTIPAGFGGLWDIWALAYFASNATGLRAVRIAKNGVYLDANALAPASGEPTGLHFSTPKVLAAGDYLELTVRQTSGGALNLTSAHLTATFLGAA